jgi:hypothetical protein
MSAIQEALQDNDCKVTFTQRSNALPVPPEEPITGATRLETLICPTRLRNVVAVCVRISVSIDTANAFSMRSGSPSTKPRPLALWIKTSAFN